MPHLLSVLSQLSPPTDQNCAAQQIGSDLKPVKPGHVPHRTKLPTVRRQHARNRFEGVIKEAFGRITKARQAYIGRLIIVVQSRGLNIRRITISLRDTSRHTAIETAWSVESRLLERTTRHVAVTPGGTACYQWCLSILADLEEAEGALRGHEPSGLLRIASGRGRCGT